LVKQVYLDNNATTPLDPRVLSAMNPFFMEKFGNPASRHSHGWLAKDAVEKSRKIISTEIHAKSRDVIFTSGATESVNLVIKGLCQSQKHQGKHIITQVTEHKAVLDTCAAMEKDGFDITYVEVEKEGRVDPQKVRDAIRDDTFLVAIMHANNEIGVIQPIGDIGELCREKNILFFVDAAQTFAKIPLNVKEMNIDFLAGTAHKIYGPKGIGFLYIKSESGTDLHPQIHGGGHERGLRSGTLPVPQIVGFGKAVELCIENREAENREQKKLRDILIDKIIGSLPGTLINGSMDHRLTNNVNFTFPTTDGDSLLMKLEDIAVSSGSACTSAKLESSYVLQALGHNNELAKASIRIGLGRFTTEDDIDYAATQIIKAIK